MTKTLEEQKKALIIGISEYEKLSQLKFCKKDAEATHDLLCKLEYTIEDTLIGTVRWLRMRDALYDFFMNENIRPGDTLIFYFSGHGVTDSNGNMYFATSEIDPFLPNKRGIPFNELTNMIQQSISKKIVVVLDCCYSGTAKLSKNDEYSAAMLGKEAIQEELKNFSNSEGKFILASCQSNQEAYALEENDHSLFTYYFLEGLKGNKLAANEGGYITTSTLSAFIYDEIMSLPSEKRLKQTPVTKMEASGQIIMAYYPNLSRNNNIEIKTIDSFVTYPEYIQRTDVLPLLRYDKFFGREEELEKLKEFLESDKKIMIIVGEQGTGKSRLLLEFARGLITEPLNVSHWKPLFIQPFQDFFPTSLNGETLIIVDETVRYRDINKIIDYVLNIENDNSKLLLSTSPAFLNSLESQINQMNYSTELINLSKGNISDFLKWYYPYLDERNRELIVQECGNSFIFAIIYSEYWKEDGSVYKDIENILSWKVAKYIKYLSEKTGLEIEDVSYIINIISFILPIKWSSDQETLKQVLPAQKYNSLENILQEIRFEKYENTIISFQNSKYIRNMIPLCNHILFKSVKNREITGILEELIPYFSYRILYNIIIATITNGTSSEDVTKLLNSIWCQLSNKDGMYIEYLSSIRFLTAFPDVLSTLDLTKLNSNRWLRSYENLRNGDSSEKSKIDILVSIYNIIHFYGNSGELFEMNKVLEQFETYCQRKPDKDFDLMLGICFALACDYCGNFNHLKKMDFYLDKLRILYKKYISDLYQNMASSLSGAYISHISSDDITLPRQLDNYLKEIRQICHSFPEERTIEKYSRVLASAIINSSKNRKINQLLEYFREIELIYQKYPNVVRPRLILALRESAPYLSEDDRVLLYKTMEKLFVEIRGHLGDNNIIRSGNREQSESKLKELVPTIIDYSFFRFNGGVAICVNDLNRPSHLSRLDEMEYALQEYAFNGHIFLNLEKVYGETMTQDITLLICPFRILNDDEYSDMIRDLSGLTWEPIINDYVEKTASFHLTDLKVKSILQNPRITLEQKNNMLDNGPYVYLRINIKFTLLSTLYSVLQETGTIDLSNRLSYCSYCKELDTN